MTNFGPFAPAGWTSADQVCCSASSFNAISVQGEGGYIDDTDTGTYSVALRFPVNTTGMVSFTSASLVLKRTPNAYGEGGANGTIGIRIEDSTSSAEYSSGANPWGRTFRTAQVDYNFPSDGSTVTIDVSAIFSDFYAAKGVGAHTITLMFGAQARGWQASSVSYRCITNQQNTGGVLPSLTIIGTDGNEAVTVSKSGEAVSLSTNQAPVSTSASNGGLLYSVSQTRGSAAPTVAFAGLAASLGIALGRQVSNASSVATGQAPTLSLLVGSSAAAVNGAGAARSLSELFGAAAASKESAGFASALSLLRSQLSTSIPGTIFPTLSDYFTHTIPGRPRTIMFWAWDLNDDYNYLWMSGADYFYRDIVFDEEDPRFGEPGWLIFEKNQGAQRIYIERRYWGRWCACLVYRNTGDVDVYYGHEGEEMNLVGTTTDPGGDSTEWWFGMFETVIGWSGGVEYLYIDNAVWDIARIRAQFRQRNPVAPVWGFFPLENGSGNAEVYGSPMTRNGNPVADTQGVQFPPSVPIEVLQSGICPSISVSLGAGTASVTAVGNAYWVGVSSAVKSSLISRSGLAGTTSLSEAAGTATSQRAGVAQSSSYLLGSQTAVAGSPAVGLAASVSLLLGVGASVTGGVAAGEAFSLSLSFGSGLSSASAAGLSYQASTVKARGAHFLSGTGSTVSLRFRNGFNGVALIGIRKA